MHDIDFLKESTEWIKSYRITRKTDTHIELDITTVQFGVCKSRPYRFSIKEWEEVRERGYVEV